MSRIPESYVILTKSIIISMGPPWVDGEKIPDDRLEEIYLHPPGVPVSFVKSQLIIGSRGVGKTTLFRFQKLRHPGIAIHLSLATVFSSITKQSGLGPLSFDCPPGIEPLISAKASSLLAMSLCERLSAKGVVLSADLLRPCLPESATVGAGLLRDVDFDSLRRHIVASPLKNFETAADMGQLPQLVAALGKSAQRHHGPLLLLLDRADMVSSATLVPIIDLLDQSEGFVVLVAMRPGHAGDIVANFSASVVAGDHYGVVHLGTEPRSQEWIKFVENAVRAQLQINSPEFDRPLADVLAKAIQLSRESLRTVLEVVARASLTTSGNRVSEAILAFDDVRESLLTAAQTTLQKFNVDFRQFVNSCRDEMLHRRNTDNRPPLLISFSRNAPETLFDKPTKLNRFIELALRCGAFCMPEGERWVPASQPTSVELPPLLTWQPKDRLEFHMSGLALRLSRRERDLFSPSRGAQKAPSIFIAYRMQNAESKEFRTSLQRAIAEHPQLSYLLIKDGHVLPGETWAEKIRERIRSARIVVGDVTGLRPDVLFEVGFAYGMGRVIIPVLSKTAEISLLPRWLGATQLAHFGDRPGIGNILTSLSAYLADPEYEKPNRTPQAIPGIAVWLRKLPWNETALERFITAAQREDLRFEVHGDPDPDERIIRRAASASLLVISLDGSRADALMHYVCGAVIAKPTTGYGRKLDRKIMIVEQDPTWKGKYVADSLRRCQSIVDLVTPDTIAQRVEDFGKAYRKWLSSPAKRRA